MFGFINIAMERRVPASFSSPMEHCSFGFIMVTLTLDQWWASVPIQIGYQLKYTCGFRSLRKRKMVRLVVCFSSLNRAVWRRPEDGPTKRTNSHCNCHIWMVAHQWIDRGFGWNEIVKQINGNCREWSLVGFGGWAQMDKVIFFVLIFPKRKQNNYFPLII